MALELKVSFIFKLLHDLYHLQSSLTNVHSSLMNYSQEAKSAAKVVIKGKMKSESIAEKRICLLTDLKTNLDEAQDNLSDESQQSVGLQKLKKIQLDIKRERTVGRHGGSSKLSLHIVLLICELLVNGTSPSAVAANIQAMSATISRRKVNELPCIDLVQKYRVVVQNLNSPLAALWLGDTYEWHQLFTDGTPRLQIAFQNLVIVVMVDSKLDPVIV